jgi:hypothetical protein
LVRHAVTPLQPRPRDTPRRPRSRIAPFLVTGLVAVAVFILSLPAIQPSADESCGQWSVAQLLQQAQAGDVRSLVINGDTGVAVDRDGGSWRVTLDSDASRVAIVLSTEGVSTTRESEAFNWLPRYAPEVAAISFGWLWSGALFLVLGILVWFALSLSARPRS